MVYSFLERKPPAKGGETQKRSGQLGEQADSSAL
jgi:hypothetical protein